jgi:hypothetical protein
MKQSKKTPRTAGVAGDNLLRSVQGGGTPLPAGPRGPDGLVGDELQLALRRPPVELPGTPLPA